MYRRPLRATEPGFAGYIGAIDVWLIDWLINDKTQVRTVHYNTNEFVIIVGALPGNELLGHSVTIIMSQDVYTRHL